MFVRNVYLASTLTGSKGNAHYLINIVQRTTQQVVNAWLVFMDTFWKKVDALSRAKFTHLIAKEENKTGVFDALIAIT